MQQLGRVSRLPALPYSSDPALREFFDDTRRRGGQVINLHLTLAHAPKMALARRATAECDPLRRGDTAAAARARDRAHSADRWQRV